MIKSTNEYLEIIDNEDIYHRNKEPASDEVWIDLIKNYPELHPHIVLNKTLSPRILEYLARSNDNNVRWHIANKRRLNDNTFELLAKDFDSSVRSCIVCNPKVPRFILELLAQDSCEDTFGDDLTISDIAKKRLTND